MHKQDQVIGSPSDGETKLQMRKNNVIVQNILIDNEEPSQKL